MKQDMQPSIYYEIAAWLDDKKDVYLDKWGN